MVLGVGVEVVIAFAVVVVAGVAVDVVNVSF